MRPSLLKSEDIETYLNAGHWSRETMLHRYATFAAKFPNTVACRDQTESYTWAELESVTDCLAANLIELGLDRDERALVQIPSSCREVVLRIGLKKAGIIGAFAPLQWRRKELEYVLERITPRLIVMSQNLANSSEFAWLDSATENVLCPAHRIGVGSTPLENWLTWNDMLKRPSNGDSFNNFAHRPFKFNEISLITVSSGTSSLAKLCEWPEGAQMCLSRVLGERLGITKDDNVGIFAPMSGAAGLVVWMVSGTIPCTFTFSGNYNAAELLNLVQQFQITVGTTVPVILARLAQESLRSYDLSSLRILRVGTAAADIGSAKSFEVQTGCKVIVASGSMECPGFGHASADEPKHARLNGSVGLPLRGCRLRIEDDQGNSLPAGTYGELKVSAPFASSGYWDDTEMTAAVWSKGWYATGDIGFLDNEGRLTLNGRIKEIINRSGHKILPTEVEKEIRRHPDIFECAVVSAPDKEYGEVPWAFVQLRSGCTLDLGIFPEVLKENGIASYKIPSRFIEIADFPRVSGNKIDKKVLLQMAPPIARPSRTD